MTRWSSEHGMVVRRAGDGPELVWLHGLGEWSVSFDPVARHPALAGLCHVLPDLPGYGRSPRPGPASARTLERLADLLAGWLAERPPAVVLGHSMGGVLATMIAGRTAVRAVIDVEGNLTRGDCTHSAQAAAYTSDEFAGHGMAAMRDEVYAGGLGSRALRSYHAALAAACPRVFHDHGSDLVALSSPATLIERLTAIRAPALYIAGVPDGICARSRELLTARRVRWVGLEPSGHWVHLDQLDQFATTVAAFVRELP